MDPKVSGSWSEANRTGRTVTEREGTASPAAGGLAHPGWQQSPFGAEVPWGPSTGCLMSTQNKIRQEPRGQNHKAAMRLARRQQPWPRDRPRWSRPGVPSVRRSVATCPSPSRAPLQVTCAVTAAHVCLGEGDPSWNGVKPSPRVLEKPSGQPKDSCSLFRQLLTMRDLLRHQAERGGGPPMCAATLTWTEAAIRCLSSVISQTTVHGHNRPSFLQSL